MEIRQYLNSLETVEQHAFASACGTSVNYIRKAACIGQKFDAALAVRMDRHSKRAVTVDELRPDVDWDYVRNAAPVRRGKQLG